MNFFIKINPPTKTHQEHRVGIRKDGTPYIYEDHDLQEVRAMYRRALSKKAPAVPVEGPIRLLVKWCFPNGKHKDGTYKTTKPDTDNLNKLLKDVMTEVGFWKDDAQVSSEIIEKFWAKVPGIYVEVIPLETDKGTDD